MRVFARQGDPVRLDERKPNTLHETPGVYDKYLVPDWDHRKYGTIDWGPQCPLQPECRQQILRDLRANRSWLVAAREANAPKKSEQKYWV